MSDEATTPVDETVVPATEETCVDGVCADGTPCTPTEEAPATTEATPAAE